MTAFDQRLAASFRGVPFLVPADFETGGKKVAVHEYPGAAKRFVEELGGLQPSFDIQALVHGELAVATRRRLVQALSQPGLGTLAHPHLGSIQVACIDYRIQASDEAVGRFVFDIRFLQSEANISLNPLAAGAAKVTDSAAAARDAVQNAGQSRYNPVRIATSARKLADRLLEGGRLVRSQLAAVINPVADGVAAVSRTVDELRDSAISIVRQPLPLVSAIKALMDSGRSVAALPADLRREWFNVTNFGNGRFGEKRLPIKRTTRERQVLDDNFRVVEQSIRLHSLVNFSEALAYTTFTTATDIQAAIQQLAGAYARVTVNADDVIATSTLGDEILTPENVTDPLGPAPESAAFQDGISFDAAVIEALETLKTDTFAVLNQNLQNAWQVQTVNFGTTDAVLATYGMYGNLDQVDLIADLNRHTNVSYIRDPLFVAVP